MNKRSNELIFSETDFIVTERLILRKMRTGDANDMFEYACDSDVTKYLTWEPHPDADYTRRYLGTVERAYKKRTFFDWAVTLKANLKMVGSCGFTSFDYEKDCCEVGYVLNPRYRGYELMPEAVNAVIKFAFENLGAKAVTARFMKGNDASLRVMEKCRMTFVGYEENSIVCRGRGITVGTCVITLSEYRTKT